MPSQPNRRRLSRVSCPNRIPITPSVLFPTLLAAIALLTVQRRMNECAREDVSHLNRETTRWLFEHEDEVASITLDPIHLDDGSACFRLSEDQEYIPPGGAGDEHVTAGFWLDDERTRSWAGAHQDG